MARGWPQARRALARWLVFCFLCLGLVICAARRIAASPAAQATKVKDRTVEITSSIDVTDAIWELFEAHSRSPG